MAPAQVTALVLWSGPGTAEGEGAGDGESLWQPKGLEIAGKMTGQVRRRRRGPDAINCSDAGRQNSCAG